MELEKLKEAGLEIPEEVANYLKTHGGKVGYTEVN